MRKIKVFSLKNEHYLWLDVLRGMAVIAMITFHILYDIYFIFDKELSWFPSEGSFLCQQMIGVIFAATAGVSCFLSSKNIKRGIKIALIALLITITTYLFIPSQVIWFGILHMLSGSIIIIGVLKKFLKGDEYLGFLIVSLLAFCITWFSSYCGGWYTLKIGILSIPFGFPPKGFYSSDYYPMLPWFFVVAGGFFSAPYLNFKKRVGDTRFLVTKIIVWIGQNSLIIYLIHQPIIILVLMAILKS